jgi:transposase
LPTRLHFVDAEGYFGTQPIINFEGGEQIGKFMKLTNTRTSLDKFLEQIKIISEKQGAEVRIGLEATGIYWYSLFSKISEDHKISIYNPTQIHAFANVNVRGSKTDKIDAKTIANMLRFGNAPQTDYSDKQRLELREYVRFHWKLTTDGDASWTTADRTLANNGKRCLKYTNGSENWWLAMTVVNATSGWNYALVTNHSYWYYGKGIQFVFYSINNILNKYDGENRSVNDKTQHRSVIRPFCYTYPAMTDAGHYDFGFSGWGTPSTSGDQGRSSFKSHGNGKVYYMKPVAHNHAGWQKPIFQTEMCFAWNENEGLIDGDAIALEGTSKKFLVKALDSADTTGRLNYAIRYV